jgi:hypothetical protein
LHVGLVVRRDSQHHPDRERFPLPGAVRVSCLAFEKIANKVLLSAGRREFGFWVYGLLCLGLWRRKKAQEVTSIHFRFSLTQPPSLHLPPPSLSTFPFRVPSPPPTPHFLSLSPSIPPPSPAQAIVGTGRRFLCGTVDEFFFSGLGKEKENGPTAGGTRRDHQVGPDTPPWQGILHRVHHGIQRDPALGERTAQEISPGKEIWIRRPKIILLALKTDGKL